MIADNTIAVTVSSLTLDPVTGLPVALLIDDLSKSTLAVSIGIGEASAIAAELDGIELERPMTHQLALSMLEAVGATISAVEIYDARGGCFFARIHLREPDGNTRLQEARPSDALAMALHCEAPILIQPHVLHKATTRSWPNGDFVVAPACTRASRDGLLESLEDEAFGKWKI